MGLVEEAEVSGQANGEWILAIYGIPEGLDAYRDKLRNVCRNHGLTKIDRGGSVYLGPAKPDFDESMEKALGELRQQTGEKLVYFVHGSYGASQTLVFRDAVVKNLFEDIDLIEKNMDELEKALVGEVELKDNEGKPRDPVKIGKQRIRTARELLNSGDYAAIRLDAKYGKQAVKVRQRVSEVRACVDKISQSVERMAGITVRGGGRSEAARKAWATRRAGETKQEEAA